jgi:hypothetical protein
MQLISPKKMFHVTSNFFNPPKTILAGLATQVFAFGTDLLLRTKP